MPIDNFEGPDKSMIDDPGENDLQKIFVWIQDKFGKSKLDWKQAIYSVYPKPIIRNKEPWIVKEKCKYVKNNFDKVICVVPDLREIGPMLDEQKGYVFPVGTAQENAHLCYFDFSLWKPFIADQFEGTQRNKIEKIITPFFTEQ